ncbi:E3 ubiquitin-protein ligase RING1-like [Acorus calamus]|uniref:RING-type E3 ubiquitin transferase n=1 Tax=Acorus calamus TaxID=4465 RepID=A0AAV9CZJ0_ACOCL|nr:E3 ubiquitin-protein ligase RING1-like [Acorus calamus]
MDETLVSNYWCYMCTEWVNPIMEAEIKCPLCHSGFIEAIEGQRPSDNNHNNADDGDGDSDSDANIFGELGSDRSLSLWAPILLGMMGGPMRHRRRHRRGDSEVSEALDAELGRDWDLESILRRRQRRLAALQLIRDLREGRAEDSENLEAEGERRSERVILINPFDQTIILEGLVDQSRDDDAPSGSFGDYFLGSSLDQLLQHLSENDPNRYGTPPARKEAVEALPTVKIDGLPSEGSKESSNGFSVNGGDNRSESVGNGGRRSLPWPFNGLLSLLGSQGDGEGEISSSSSSSSSSNPDEN